MGTIARTTIRVSGVGVTLFVAAIAFPATALAGGAVAPQSSHEAVEAGRWALLIALAFLVIGVPLIVWIASSVWWQLTRNAHAGPRPRLPGRSLIIGQDNRVSTSKTVSVVWTYTVASALLSFIIARWMGHSGGYDNLIATGVDAQYALLFGGPLGAAILAKGIVSAQLSSGDTAKPAADNPALGQLVQNDVGDTDLGDLQYVLFNVLALVFFFGEILRVPQSGMPTIPDVLLGLTSVAAVGYVGKKALGGAAAIANVFPAAASVGVMVKIVTSGIVQPGDDLSLVTVSFGAAKATEPTLTPTTTQGVVLHVAVPSDAAGKPDLTVSAPNGKSATWPAFKVVPNIDREQPPLQGSPGSKVTVMTTGVQGLGANLLGLAVTIADHAAETELDSSGNLTVTVPDDAPIGATSIKVTTPGGTDFVPLTVTPPGDVPNP